MSNSVVKRLALLAAIVGLVLGTSALVSSAMNYRHLRDIENDHDDDEETVEFDETAIFFEYNSTDKDLGIQIFWDAEGWEEVEVTGPDGSVFEVENGGALQDIGSTEVFTESAEPALCPEENEDCEGPELQAAIDAFLMMFPEGEYEFEGETVEGMELEGTAELSWDLPEPVELIDPEGNFPLIVWTSDGDDTEVVGYQAVAEMVVEDEEGEEIVYVQATDLPASITSIEVSPEFAQAAEDFEAEGVLIELKVELIAIGDNGNKTITEETIFEAEEEE